MINMKEKMMMTKFKPFEEVLVRNNNNDTWHIDIYDYEFVGYNGIVYKCLGGLYLECIPFKGNEKYYLTTKEYKEPWTPKKDEIVAVSDDKKHWYIKQFICCSSETYKSKSYVVKDDDDVLVFTYCEPLSKHFKFS